MRGLDYKLEESKVVAKVLRSLAQKFDFVVVVIEELRNISKLTLDELSKTLQTHEIRVNRTVVKFTEKALHMKGEVMGSSHCKGASSSSHQAWSNGNG